MLERTSRLIFAAYETLMGGNTESDRIRRPLEVSPSKSQSTRAAMDRRSSSNIDDGNVRPAFAKSRWSGIDNQSQSVSYFFGTTTTDADCMDFLFGGDIMSADLAALNFSSRRSTLVGRRLESVHKLSAFEGRFFPNSYTNTSAVDRGCLVGMSIVAAGLS